MTYGTRLRHILVLSLMALPLQLTPASGIESIVVDSRTVSVDLSGGAGKTLILSRDVDTSPEEVYRSLIAKEGPSPMDFGYSSGTVWYLLNISGLDLGATFILWERHGLEFIDLYRLDRESGLFDLVGRGGYGITASSRTIQGPRAAFPLVVEKGHISTYLLKISSRTSLKLSFMIDTQAQYYLAKGSHNFLQGIFYGVILITLILSLLVQPWPRFEGWLLFFSIFLAGVVILYLYGTGFGDWFVWPEAPWVNYFAYPLSLAMTILGASYMLLDFFRVQSWSRAWNLVMNTYMALVGILLVLNLVLEPAFASLLLSILTLTFPFLFTFISLAAMKQRIDGSLFFFLSWVLYLATVFLVVLGNFGLIGGIYAASTLSQFGVLPVLLLFTLAFRNRLVAGHSALTEAKSSLEARLEDQNQELAVANLELQGALSQLRETQQDLVEGKKLEALGDLVAGLAHELNTPLGTSLTAVSAVHARFEDQAGGGLSPLEDMVKSTLPLLERNIQRSINLVQSFKALALEGETRERSPQNLVDIIDQVRLHLGEMISFGKVEIERSLETSFQVMASRDRVMKLFHVLFENALRHGFGIRQNPRGFYLSQDPDYALLGEGKRTIRVTAGFDEETLHIQVFDNGKGMSVDMMTHLFEPFRTGDRSGGSAGLGLSIARSIVVGDLRGRISVDPYGDKARGWSFMVHMMLPLAEHPQD